MQATSSRASNLTASEFGDYNGPRLPVRKLRGCYGRSRALPATDRHPVVLPGAHSYSAHRPPAWELQQYMGHCRDLLRPVGALHVHRRPGILLDDQRVQGAARHDHQPAVCQARARRPRRGPPAGALAEIRRSRNHQDLAGGDLAAAQGRRVSSYSRWRRCGAGDAHRRDGGREGRTCTAAGDAREQQGRRAGVKARQAARGEAALLKDGRRGGHNGSFSLKGPTVAAKGGKS